jgi:hypothetical protein
MNLYSVSCSVLVNVQAAAVKSMPKVAEPLFMDPLPPLLLYTTVYVSAFQNASRTRALPIIVCSKSKGTL